MWRRSCAARKANAPATLRTGKGQESGSLTTTRPRPANRLTTAAKRSRRRPNCCKTQSRFTGTSGVSSREAVIAKFTGVKVFSATKAKERDDLGEQVTRWLRANADLEIVDRTVVQSSDNEFHCLTVVLFYKPLNGAAKP